MGELLRSCGGDPCYLSTWALASKHFQRASDSSAKRNTGFRKGGRTYMGKLGVLPRGSNGLEAKRWVSDNS